MRIPFRSQYWIASSFVMKSTVVIDRGSALKHIILQAFFLTQFKIQPTSETKNTNKTVNKKLHVITNSFIVYYITKQ